MSGMLNLVEKAVHIQIVKECQGLIVNMIENIKDFLSFLMRKTKAIKTFY